jgi:nicotinamidase-related amidase
LKALIIVDMQVEAFSEATPRFDAENIIKRINQLSDHFRRSGHYVIFIQHDGTRENICIPGSPEWKIIPTLNRNHNDLTLSKTANDAFYMSDLDNKLRSLDIDEVYVTGCATDFCVDATIRSALAHDYNVCPVEDGHTTANRVHLSAEKIIEHHNWIWENMIPTNGVIKVLSTRQILEHQLS